MEKLGNKETQKMKPGPEKNHNCKNFKFLEEILEYFQINFHLNMLLCSTEFKSVTPFQVYNSYDNGCSYIFCRSKISAIFSYFYATKVKFLEHSSENR